MIDHSRAFKVFKELKNPENLGTHCPRALLASLRGLDAHNLGQATKDVLTEGQVAGLLARRDFIVKYFEAKIAEVGEKQVLYDLPPEIMGPPALR